MNASPTAFENAPVAVEVGFAAVVVPTFVVVFKVVAGVDEGLAVVGEAAAEPGIH